MSWPDSTLADIARAPADRPVLVLLRHAERPDMQTGDAGLHVALTDAGRDDARRMGARLNRSITDFWSSPVPRCIETAQLMRAAHRGLSDQGSAATAEAVQLDRRLGDPGAFVADPDRAWPAFRDNPLAWVIEQQVIRDTALPGFALPTVGTRALVEGLMPERGVRIAVTHDALLGVVAGRTLGDAGLSPPGFLEGLVAWPVPGGFRVRYRGRETAIDGTSLKPRPSLPVRKGRICAPNLELSVARHCNLACAGCSHLSPTLPKSFVDPDALARDLRRLAQVYRAERVKLMGGEPLLHPELPAVIQAVRSSGVGERVILCTNGRLLRRTPDSTWTALDGIVVSRYPDQLDDVALASARARARRLGVDFEVFDFDHFRQSWSASGTDDETLVHSIWKTCHVAHHWRCHNLDGGRLAQCPQALMLPRVVDGLPAGGVDLRAGAPGTADLRERLLDHFDRQEPLAACRHCLGTAGVRVAHHQRRANWRQPHDQPTERLVDRAHLAAMTAAAGPIAQGCLADEGQPERGGRS